MSNFQPLDGTISETCQSLVAMSSIPRSGSEGGFRGLHHYLSRRGYVVASQRLVQLGVSYLRSNWANATEHAVNLAIYAIYEVFRIDYS